MLHWMIVLLEDKASLVDRFGIRMDAARVLPLQAPFQKGRNPLLHENLVIEASGNVALIWEEQELVLLSALDQRVDQTSRVAKVDVFIDQPVDQQEAAIDPVDVGHDLRSRITVRIGSRGSHVSLGVAGIVSVPARYHGSGNSNLEDVGTLGEAHGTHVSSVAPAVNCHSRRIDNALFDPVLDGRHLVLHFQVSHVVTNCRFKVQTPSGRPAVVDLDNGVSLGTQPLGTQIHRHSVAVRDHLRVGSTIHRNDRWVGSLSVNLRIGFVNGTV
mmetsp:Transcript_10429/g.30498  ORF Transcript_10429/g.30498 Transcript_10429/m.30498 type:complete len:271 (-) Transcript_10429:1132-1944(-)